MDVLTTRFGPISVRPEDVIEFPKGLVGIPQLRRFVLLRDAETVGLNWLQSARDPAWALALVPPRTIEPTYQIRASIDQLTCIQATDARDVDVFVALNRTVQNYFANMQAPIAVNRRLKLGVQLVLSDARYAVRHVVNFGVALRKSA